MGREEVGPLTRPVSTSTCVLTYAAALGVVGYTFAASDPGGRHFRASAQAVLGADGGDGAHGDSYWSGLAAMTYATCTIYAFSILCSNSSLR